MTVRRVLVSLLFTLSALMTAADPGRLPGRWSGVGRFYNVKFQATFGPLPFDLHIAQDLTLTGTVGGARILPCRPTTNHGRQDFRAELEGAIRPEKAFRKRRLVLMVTKAEGDTLVADFHLKTNFVWDWTMRVGHLEATRMQ